MAPPCHCFANISLLALEEDVVGTKPKDVTAAFVEV